MLATPSMSRNGTVLMITVTCRNSTRLDGLSMWAMSSTPDMLKDDDSHYIPNWKPQRCSCLQVRHLLLSVYSTPRVETGGTNLFGYAYGTLL